MTSFEDSHYILLFRYLYGAQLLRWFCYSKHLHVNRNYRPNGTATSLSSKCYSANVPLDFCTTADFEVKYLLTKALLVFWVIPNWFSRFCSKNGYLNSKLMLRWDGHFKAFTHSFGKKLTKELWYANLGVIPNHRRPYKLNRWIKSRYCAVDGTDRSHNLAFPPNISRTSDRRSSAGWHLKDLHKT